MSSIKEVARIANVSIATVSRYINKPEQVKEATRNKVQAAISDTGYAPNTLARNFRRGKSGIIFVVLPTIGDPFFAGVMKGIQQVADEQHYSIFIRETRFNTLTADDYSNMIFSKQADGIILLASICPITPTNLSRDNKKRQPIIISCESVTQELSHFPSVRIDNISAAMEATSYLIEQAHKRIGFIYGSHTSTLTQDRELGYQKAMEAGHLSISEGWIVEGGLSIQGAREATRTLLAHPKRPTAIFCANDEMAMGAVHEIKLAGLNVPKDISVIGFDDIRYAEVLDPPLTTIAQPSVEIGERTMHRLIKAIEGVDIGAEAEIVPHELIVRGSTGPAPKK
jgi:LacI family repressor for deo operon, udp, cdd, tsx, nupC, and nupG